MLTPTYSTSKRVGYQVIAGFGVGAVAVQLGLSCDVSWTRVSLTSLYLAIRRDPESRCGEPTLRRHGHPTLPPNLGRRYVSHHRPDYLQPKSARIDPQVCARCDANEIIESGTTSFRSVVTASDLPKVLRAYSKSVDHLVYLVCGCSVTAFCTAWAMGWKDIRKRKLKPEEPNSRSGMFLCHVGCIIIQLAKVWYSGAGRRRVGVRKAVFFVSTYIPKNVESPGTPPGRGL